MHGALLVEPVKEKLKKFDINELKTKDVFRLYILNQKSFQSRREQFSENTSLYVSQYLYKKI